MNKKKVERKPKSKKIRDGFVRYTLYIREEYLNYLKTYADNKRVWITDAIDDAIEVFVVKKRK
jgi:hypothetical protein